MYAYIHIMYPSRPSAMDSMDANTRAYPHPFFLHAGTHARTSKVRLFVCMCVCVRSSDSVWTTYMDNLHVYNVREEYKDV